MSRGYVVLATNNRSTDYIKCAEALALSVLWVMPSAKISLVTDQAYENTIFDQVIELPHGNLARNEWQLENDWQIWEASPYDETIKLEADMFVPQNIDWWWEPLSINDVCVCTTIRNFRGEISPVKTYRSFIIDNHLPDTYNAITYFKKTPTAKRFFQIVRDVFVNWDEYRSILKCESDTQVTTDWAYAIAAHIIGPEKTTMPQLTGISMTHMKRAINDTFTEDWTDSLVYELSPESFRINTFAQLYPVHYHVKSFADKILGSIA